MDWDLENENLRLERMIIIYQEEIKKLEEEKSDLEEEVSFLRDLLDMKSLGYEKYDDTSE
jgi:predicted nuclease with TOPRIM domain|tara:strand:- start:335 stop:514 length:180 start_codon:yes stop_codon:yes gene_type:complete